MTLKRGHSRLPAKRGEILDVWLVLTVQGPNREVETKVRLQRLDIGLIEKLLVENPTVQGLPVVYGFDSTSPLTFYPPADRDFEIKVSWLERHED